MFTSHVFLSLEHHEGIAPVRLAFLVTLLMSMCICDDPNLAEVSNGS
jgi:hypothetical protein